MATSKAQIHGELKDSWERTSTYVMKEIPFNEANARKIK
jgi:hypothetical protein